MPVRWRPRWTGPRRRPALQGGGGADHVDDGVEPADLVEVDLLGRPPVQPPLDVRQRRNAPSARAVTRSADLLHQAVMCAAVRTTPVSAVRTCALVAAIPHRRTGSTSSSQPVDREQRQHLPHPSRSAPASIRDPSAMSPAMPKAVEPGQRHLSIRSTAQAAPNPLVDAHHRDARRAGRQHGQQGGHAAQAGAVADAGGDRDDRGGVMPPTRLASATSMPATTTTASASTSAEASSRWTPATPRR